jgi:hypothetical protein
MDRTCSRNGSGKDNQENILEQTEGEVEVEELE